MIYHDSYISLFHEREREGHGYLPTSLSLSLYMHVGTRTYRSIAPRADTKIKSSQEIYREKRNPKPKREKYEKREKESSSRNVSFGTADIVDASCIHVGASAPPSVLIGCCLSPADRPPRRLASAELTHR